MYTMLMKNGHYLGIDVGGTKIAAGVITSRGRIRARAKIPTPKGASCKKIASLITRICQTLCAESKLRMRDIRGIGIGIPGIVDAERGRIISTPNMNLSGTNFGKILKQGIPSGIYLGNDVNLGVLGEQWRGAAQNTRNVVGLFVGTGLGAGVIVNGKLLLGAHGAAAEIGHMVINPAGPRCSCGNRGCLEAYIGRWAIERDIRAAIKKGGKPSLKKLASACEKPVKSKILRKALKKKDPVVTPLMREVSEILGRTCISLRHIFDPEIIVLGGGVIEACAQFMLPVVQAAFKTDKFFKGIQRCRIVKSQLGDDAVILGAAAYAIQRGLAGVPVNRPTR